MRAAIYARFSSDLQRDASIEDQVRSCTDLAERQGLTVIEIYTDRAVSGASLMHSGIQKLLRDARAGCFDIVLSEALGRLSRNQADIAQIYQTLLFGEVMIETVAEGVISEMRIGLKGTMNALFIRDLAIKTHRGLKGRALAGKSAGGLTYGYRVLHQVTKNGEVARGDRVMDLHEAAASSGSSGITREEYPRGRSPNSSM